METPSAPAWARGTEKGTAGANGVQPALLQPPPAGRAGPASSHNGWVADAPAGTAASASAELFRSVGSRVRALRQERGFTLDELSVRSGVSRRTITLLEAGQANASLATLDKLARSLGTGFVSLVLPRPPAPLVPVVPAEVAPIWEDQLGSSAKLLATYPGAGQLEVWHWDLMPGASYQAEADPPGTEEVVLVARGQLALDVAGEHFALGSGAYVRVPTDRGYCYSNTGRSLTSFITVVLQR